ncbi:MarR family winged helix-turn-helix transcriptional regulator [Mycolicibacter minnesotensis]
MQTHWLNTAEQRMWRAYLDSTRLLLRSLDRQLAADSGLSLSDFEILALLSEAPGRRLRMNELADITVTTRSGVTRAVRRLTEAGWVCQVRSEEDRRGQYAELTESGLDKLRAAAPGHAKAVRAGLFDAVSPREVELFAGSYERIRDNLLEHP